MRVGVLFLSLLFAVPLSTVAAEGASRATLVKAYRSALCSEIKAPCTAVHVAQSVIVDGYGYVSGTIGESGGMAVYKLGRHGTWHHVTGGGGLCDALCMSQHGVPIRIAVALLRGAGMDARGYPLNAHNH